MTLPEHVVFFDGVCRGCAEFVGFVMRADKSGRIMFSPIQGKTAEKFSLDRNMAPDDWKIVYVDENGVHQGADAVLSVLAKLGGLWRIPASAIYLPASVKELIYAAVSKNRYRIFGRKDTCSVSAFMSGDRFLP